jgi:hypothetical protein
LEIGADTREINDYRNVEALEVTFGTYTREEKKLGAVECAARYNDFLPSEGLFSDSSVARTVSRVRVVHALASKIFDSDSPEKLIVSTGLSLYISWYENQYRFC